MTYILLYVVVVGLGYLYKYNKNIIKLIFIILILFSGFRYKIGADFTSYLKIFELAKNNPTHYEVIRLEKGYYFLQKFIISINGTQQLIFLIMSILSNFFIYIFIKRNSKNILLSIFIFFMIGAYYSFGFNGIRQYLAISIFLYSFKFIENKNFKKYLLMIFIGSLFHKTILFCLPLYFILNFKFKFLQKAVLIFISLLLTLYLNKILIILKYGHYLSKTYYVTTSYIVLIIFLILSIYIMLFNKKILNKQQQNLNFISIILTLLIIINQKVNPSINQIFQRMGMYIFFFYIVFIPNVFESFNKEQGRILKALFFISISILYLKTFLLKLPEYKFNLILFEF